MPTRTRQVAEIDQRLEAKRRRLTTTVDPSDRADLREDIDALLEERSRLTGGGMNDG